MRRCLRERTPRFQAALAISARYIRVSAANSSRDRPDPTALRSFLSLTARAVLAPDRHAARRSRLRARGDLPRHSPLVRRRRLCRGRPGRAAGLARQRNSPARLPHLARRPGRRGERGVAAHLARIRDEEAARRGRNANLRAVPRLSQSRAHGVARARICDARMVSRRRRPRGAHGRLRRAHGARRSCFRRQDLRRSGGGRRARSSRRSA